MEWLERTVVAEEEMLLECRHHDNGLYTHLVIVHQRVMGHRLVIAPYLVIVRCLVIARFPLPRTVANYRVHCT